MLDLTFGEQVKIILRRKGMTIKELAEQVEESTGKKMSRQNLTQRLGRDNFQEQDMRMIAKILGCPFELNILEKSIPAQENEASQTMPFNIEEKEEKRIEKDRSAKKKKGPALEVQEGPIQPAVERDITVGELVEIHESLDELEEQELDEYADYEESGTSFEALRSEEESDEFEESEESEGSSLPVEEILEEVAAIEREEQEWKKEKKAPQQEEEIPRKGFGFKSYLQRRKKKNVEELHYEESDGQAEDSLAEATPSEEPEPLEELEAQDMSEELDDDIIYLDDDDALSDDGRIEDDETDDEDLELGDINPYTGREYETNSVRMHANRIGYVQVYDRSDHKWTDMTEWAFLGYQERKKALLGNDYEPPIYLD